MLHTLRHSPWHCDMTTLLRMLRDGDDLLLISDGVQAGIEGNRYLEMLKTAPISLYVLEEDVNARGFSAQISNSILRVDYTGFVRLTLKHAGQLAW